MIGDWQNGSGLGGGASELDGPMSHLDTNPEAGRAVLEVVEKQIRDNEPPETRQTFERLRAEGYPDDEARRLLATVVAVEIFHIMRDHEPFNRKRFLWNLAQLPRAPWDEQGKGRYAG